jgi:hypothetical protein
LLGYHLFKSHETEPRSPYAVAALYSGVVLHRARYTITTRIRQSAQLRTVFPAPEGTIISVTLYIIRHHSDIAWFLGRTVCADPDPPGIIELVPESQSQSQNMEIGLNPQYSIFSQSQPQILYSKKEQGKLAPIYVEPDIWSYGTSVDSSRIRV